MKRVGSGAESTYTGFQLRVQWTERLACGISRPGWPCHRRTHMQTAGRLSLPTVETGRHRVAFSAAAGVLRLLFLFPPLDSDGSSRKGLGFPVLFEHAPVHNNHESRFEGASSGLLINDAFLHPDGFGPQPNGFVNNRADRL